MISCRSRPGRSGIADVADVPAILVGDESDVGAVVVPVVVPDIVEGDCRGYRLPSGHHRHCPGTAAAGLRRPSGGSSAATDRAAVVRRLGFGLSWTDFPKAGPDIQYADDTVIMIDGSEQSVLNLKLILYLNGSLD